MPTADNAPRRDNLGSRIVRGVVTGEGGKIAGDFVKNR